MQNLLNGPETASLCRTISTEAMHVHLGDLSRDLEAVRMEFTQFREGIVPADEDPIMRGVTYLKVNARH